MRCLIIFCLFSLVSCKENVQPDTLDKVETVTEDTSSQQIQLDVYDFNGLEKFLSTKNDKVYVVNFWATWCKPCIKELPYFEALNENYDSVEVILVSLDFPSKYETQLKPYIVEHNLKSEVVALNDADSNTWIPKVDENWTGAIPATIIFNQSKRQFYERSFNYDELETEVKQFLK